MAKTAVTVLQDQIEAIRQEAYAARYAAAMQAIRDFAVKPLLPPYKRGARAKAPRRPTKPRDAAGARHRRLGRQPDGYGVAIMLSSSRKF